MSFESQQGLTQEELVKQYLAGHAEWKRLNGLTLNAIRVRDKLNEEAAPQNMIDEQQKEIDAYFSQESAALESYGAIWDKLTPETRDQYLRVESPLPSKGK